MKRVYVSGPITKGNRSWNFFQAAEAQRMLLDAGYAVLNPMLSMAHPDGHNISWEMWIASDLAFIEVCDLIVRLPGESKGADLEVQHATDRGIPVVCLSIEQLPAFCLGECPAGYGVQSPCRLN